MGPDPPPGERHAAWAVATLVAVVAFLPFLRGLLSGSSFYFRDLSRQFFPLRGFAAEGLRQGELRYWNPLVHEGEPLSLLPLSYPPDLLPALLPNEWAFSLLLALHVPLAALLFYWLCRELGLARPAAAGGAAVYALGGFVLSSLNLYVYVQAIAWAPLVVRGFLRTARGTWSDAALAALAFGLALTTSGVEIVAQSVLVGLVLAWPAPSFRTWGRFVSVLALGLGLAAYVLIPMSSLVSQSARGEGFPTEVVLAHSIHPLAFLQVLVAGFFGDPAQGAGGFWGQRFSPLGFPYILSLYLGAATLALAALGTLEGRLRRRLLLLVFVAAVVCLGSRAGLGALVDALEPLRRFRYPSKAFFTVHFAIALLAALGIDTVSRGQEAGLRRLSWLSLLGGGLLVAVPLLPALLPGPAGWFAAGFFPPEMAWSERLRHLGFMTGDAALGGLVALVVGIVAQAARRRRLTPEAAAFAMAGLLAADLLRAGAGLNPMVTSSFFTLSPEMASVARRLREDGGRVFTCDVAQSPAYVATRDAKGARQEAWSFALLRETLTPFYNMGPEVATALSLDLTMLTPLTRVASPDELACRDLAPLVTRLREAAVSHVVSLDPLESADLVLAATVRPAAARPLVVYLYALRDPRPLQEIAGGTVRVVRETPGRIQLDVDAPDGGTLVVRQTRAAGWEAIVAGRKADLIIDERGHLAVNVPSGRSRVSFAYRPPGMRAGLTVTLATLLVVGFLAARRAPARGV